MKTVNLLKENHQSEFYNDLINDELKQVLEKEELLKHYIHIKNSFIYDHEDFIEIGIYLINTSDKEVLIKNVPTTIVISQDISINNVLNINKTLKINEAVYKEVRVSKETIEEISKEKGCLDFELDLNKIEVIFSDLNNIRKYPDIDIEFINIPKIEDYKAYIEMKKFIKKLKPIDLGKLVIDVFKVGMVEEGFFIILLFRNSGNRDINISTLPISVTTDNDLLIYQNVFKSSGDSFFIPSKKGKVITLVIPKKDFPTDLGLDETKYKILFK